MNKAMFEQFANIVEGEQSLTCFVIGIVLTSLCSFALRFFYKKNFPQQEIQDVSKLVIPLALSVYIIVFVIKSSWMVSLGLLGALAIVRFRTPIKSTEDMKYIFISVVIGLGFAAGHLLYVSIGLIVIFIYLAFELRGIAGVPQGGYSCIILKARFNGDEISYVEDILRMYSKDTAIQRLSVSEKCSELSMFLNIEESAVGLITDKIQEKFPDCSISFYNRSYVL